MTSTQLFINNNSGYSFRHSKLLKAVLAQTINLQKITTKTEVSLEIVSLKAMQEICQEYAPQKKETDVLAFAAEWKTLAPLIGFNLLGDIIICYEKVVLQAKDYNHSLRREWAYLFAHGLLHLLGYDHNDAATEAQMHNEIERVMELLEVLR